MRTIIAITAALAIGLTSAVAQTATLTDFEKSFAKDLVKLGTRTSPNGNERSDVQNVEDFEPSKYYAIYFSAHWCPPCRAFTPKLVETYNDLKQNNGAFELIFASSDKDRGAMEGYMEWGSMPWLALKFSAKDDLDRFASRGIPYMVIVDREGNKLWPEGSDWVHPSQGLGELKKLALN